MFNRNNTRHRVTENQYAVREEEFQERFEVKVWLGVLGARILSPILFEEL